MNKHSVEFYINTGNLLQCLKTLLSAILMCIFNASFLLRCIAKACVSNKLFPQTSDAPKNIKIKIISAKALNQVNTCKVFVTSY